MKELIIIDVQGFKDLKNEFIVKECAIASENHTQVFLIKPPFAFDELLRQEKRRVSWIENNHGIYWSEGHIYLREFENIIRPYLENKQIIVKGNEKTKWVKKICVNCDVIDIEKKGCPNLPSLHQKFCGDNVSKFNCLAHSKQCALKNVLCIKMWHIENNFHRLSF